MNEPKRRGRPTNAERVARNAAVEGTDAVDSLHQAEMRRGVEIAALGSSEINPAQAYALRVWNGQSESADRPWRMSRVKEALEGQGLSMDGVELPA
jgi:hypothetical protein